MRSSNREWTRIRPRMEGINGRRCRRKTDGGALHSALELARVPTPMKYFRYGAPIDATPRDGTIPARWDRGNQTLPRQKGVAPETFFQPIRHRPPPNLRRHISNATRLRHLRLFWVFLFASIRGSIRVHSRLLFAGRFLCFFRPGILERDRPVKNEALRSAVSVEDEVTEALKLIPGFTSRLPQAWLAFSRNDFK